jgi:uncharacterized membrane protein YsdA (DUF1294 family)
MDVIYVGGHPLARQREPHARERQRQPQGLALASVIATTFLVLVGVAVIVGLLHWAVITLYVLASVVTYFAYAKDKRAAQTGGWRTGEGTLLLLGLAGGWPGGLIAQQRFRHKTKKVSFQVVYWFTVGLNCGGLLWLRPIILSLSAS